MMTTLKITRVFIDKVKKVEVGDIIEEKEFGFSQVHINIWNEEGDKYELVLEAESAVSLNFSKTDNGSDWLKPKVYGGKEE